MRVGRSLYVDVVGRVLEFSGDKSTCSDIRNRLHLSSSYCSMEFSSQWLLVSLLLRSNGYLIYAVQRCTTRCAAETPSSLLVLRPTVHVWRPHFTQIAGVSSSSEPLLRQETARKSHDADDTPVRSQSCSQLRFTSLQLHVWQSLF